MYARADTSGAFGIGAGSARAPSSVVSERKQKSPSRAVDERNIPRDPPKLSQQQVSDLEGSLQPGAFGIREPGPACPLFDLKKLDLLLVPGVGFAFDGSRLGRGKGHYDRMLAETTGFKCGVAFDWQLLVEIPGERHDICLDCILTPTRWHEVAGWRRH